jgi:putative Mg2+ transporter-C (MgtC) family protein
MSSSLPNVLQGVSTGIGFIGAGAILKLRDEHEIHGLTTAASVWMTAAIGLAVGLGGLGIAIVATLLMWLILSVLGRIERRVEGRDNLSNSTR